MKRYKLLLIILPAVFIFFFIQGCDNDKGVNPSEQPINILNVATLTVNKTGSGRGTVTSSPKGAVSEGIDCGSNCKDLFPLGTVVTPAGSDCDRWDFSASAGTNVTVTGTSAASLDIGLQMVFLSGGYPAPTLFWANANGLGGSETGSAITTYAGQYGIVVFNMFEGTSNGSYKLTIVSDKPISGLSLVRNNNHISCVP